MFGELRVDFLCGVMEFFLRSYGVKELSLASLVGS